MARENTVYLYGQIITVPRIRYLDGTAVSAMFSIKVLRRNANSGTEHKKIYFDCPVIRTKNKLLIEQIAGLTKGDMIITRGLITTREVEKLTICPECGARNVQQGNAVYVTPISIMCVEREVSELAGVQLLKEHNEISNNVIVIGNICKAPEFYEDANKRTYAQYQMAVNRRFHVKEDAQTTDYPWIKTFGRQATNDSRCLVVGSGIYINGALQSRDITRSTTCSCSHTYEWDESVLEIVPYYIGYLSNCNVDTDEVETEELEPREDSIISE